MLMDNIYLQLSAPLHSDECPPICSTSSLEGFVPNMVVTFVANTFSVTFCRSLYSNSTYETLLFDSFFSARCTIHLALMLRCQCPSVCPSFRLSVAEVHWRIIANLGFKFRSKFTAHCGRSPQCARMHCDCRGACREEGRGHLALC